MNKSPKSKFFIGLWFVVIAFVGFVFMFYIMGRTNMENTEQIDELEEKLTVMEIEKANTETELTDVKGKLNTINLQHLVQRAEQVYSEEERNRKEGLLWMDPETSLYIVTLGALHGLKRGAYLGVYKGDERLGQVMVDSPMDVISYVRPVDQSLQELNDNYFRVVIEEQR